MAGFYNMEVVLKELRWSYMFGYGPDNYIKLNANKITQLTAPNGSGKSTIALIIQELLYSKNVKGIRKGDILNRYADTNTWSGNLTFSINEDNYEIDVKRVGASSKVALVKNGKDISEHKIPDTYKELQKIIGDEFPVFSQITYQSSVNLLEFLQATDTNRKKFLIKLFNLQKYLDIGNVIKIKAAETEKEYATLQGELRGIKQFLDEADIPEKRNNKNVPTVDNSLRDKIAELNVEINTYEEKAKKIDKNNLYLKERDSLNFSMSLHEPSIPDKESEEIESLRQKKSNAESHRRKAHKELNNLDTADKCYACGQPLDNTHAIDMVHKLQEEISNYDEKIIEYTARIQELDTILDKHSQEYSAWNKNEKSKERFEQLTQLIDESLPKEPADYDNLLSERANLTQNLRTQELDKEEAENFNKSVDIHNTKVEALIEQKRQFLARQELLNNDIINLQSRIANQTVLKKAYSPSGIVAFKLENLTKELEDTINEYLSELSSGDFQVVFRLTGEKLNIVVVNSGKESPIETFSGGEYSRIQTAILLAIRSLLSDMGGNSINLLFLDEITGVLDNVGREKLIEVLNREENLNVFLISHDFTHPLIEKIEIKKENKQSHII